MEEEVKQEEIKQEEVTEEKPKEKKHKKDNKELEALKNQVLELSDKYKRLQAEFMNYQNRKDTEIEKLFKYDGESVIKEILPVVDNFERAIKLDDNDLSDEVSNFLSGFKMIYTNLLSSLEKFGVKELDCLGKEFDPTTSEAVLVEEDQTKPSNVVLEVLQKGYIYKDKIIRPAMVKVNK